MKASLLIAVLSLSACGNWSNKDLEFLNAMPTKEQLRVKLPVSGTSTTPLGGEGTRRDGLAVGELLKNTRDASNGFNDILEFVLGTLDKVRPYFPTTRTATSRTWGPFPDPVNTGFEAQITITQVDAENFGYAFEHRKVGGAFFTSVSGQFKATPSLKKGRGVIFIDTKKVAAELPANAGLKPLEKIEIGYFTDTDPVRVEMMFTFLPGAVTNLSTIGYTYQERTDKSGQITFAAKGVDPDVTELNIVSKWLPAGSGRAEAKVTAGNFAGASEVDCWDAALKITFANQNWPKGALVGDEKTCVTVPGF